MATKVPKIKWKMQAMEKQFMIESTFRSNVFPNETTCKFSFLTEWNDLLWSQ